METTEITEITTGPACEIALRLLQGWEPTPPPSELKVLRFRWGNDILLPMVAQRLTVEGAMLTVHCGATSGAMFEAFLKGGLRNEPVEGEAADDFIFNAQSAAVRVATFGAYPFECVKWILKKRDTQPTVWMG